MEYVSVVIEIVIILILHSLYVNHVYQTIILIHNFIVYYYNKTVLMQTHKADAYHVYKAIHYSTISVT